MDSLLKLTAEQRVLVEAIASCGDEVTRRLLLNVLLAEWQRMSDLRRTIRLVPNTLPTPMSTTEGEQ